MTLTLTPSEERRILARRREKERRAIRDEERAAKLVATPGDRTDRKSIPRAWMIAATNRQRGLCACGCGGSLTAPGSKVEGDHRIPIALGGAHEPANVQALLEPCHLEKTKRDVRAIAKAVRQAKLKAPPEKSKRPIPNRGWR
jgi:5-methylcytosine-specific restriction enzyme A